MAQCPLCLHQGTEFYRYKSRLFHQCEYCHGIFMDRALWPDTETEKARYLEHNNDVADPRYQQFVSPITDAVSRDFTRDHTGLDFGAGHAPIVTHVLTAKGYQLTAYDPLFFADSSLLQGHYDFIASCEVIEHFHQPRREFTLLKNMLKPGGRLYCMTECYDESIDFHQWQYKNDPTHVFIYHQDSLAYIQQQFGFSDWLKADRLVIFSNDVA